MTINPINPATRVASGGLVGAKAPPPRNGKNLIKMVKISKIFRLRRLSAPQPMYISLNSLTFEITFEIRALNHLYIWNTRLKPGFPYAEWRIPKKFFLALKNVSVGFLGRLTRIWYPFFYLRHPKYEAFSPGFPKTFLFSFFF